MEIIKTDLHLQYLKFPFSYKNYEVLAVDVIGIVLIGHYDKHFHPSFSKNLEEVSNTRNKAFGHCKHPSSDESMHQDEEHDRWQPIMHND